jgi:ABC-type antimicrobial peptide transport system permease subunit
VLFPGEDPIGKHLKNSISGQTWQIVGIVGDTRFSVREPVRPTMYIPIFGNRYSSATLVLRSANDVESLALPAQKIIDSIKPDIPVFDISTMDQTLGRSTLDQSFDATLLVGFAALSLVLAAVGLFGALSYTVVQRTSEIGIRIALGAQREHVLRKILLDGIGPALAGLVAGLAASAGLANLIRSILYDTQPLNPAVFGAVAGLLLLVATVACLGPAWRASRLDPVKALRAE